MQIVAEEPIETQAEFVLYKMVDVEFFLNMMNKNEFFIKSYDQYFEVKILPSQRADMLNKWSWKDDEKLKKSVINLYDELH